MRTAALSAFNPWPDGSSPSIVDAERLVRKPTPCRGSGLTQSARPQEVTIVSNNQRRHACLDRFATTTVPLEDEGPLWARTA